LGTAATLEQLGQSPLDIGAQLGGRSATAGANVGNTLLQGGVLSARTAQAGNAYSPFGTALSGAASNQAFTSGLGNIGSWQSQPNFGQYTPGTGTFVGPMMGSTNTGVSQWDSGSQGF
jgi:hypothetical protein